MELNRVTLDLGHQDVVLELLNQGVQDERGDYRVETGSRGEEDRGNRGDDRPDDREQFQEAGGDGQEDCEPPEHGIDDGAQQQQSAECRHAHRDPEDQLATHPLAEDPLHDPDQLAHIGAPRGWQRAIEGRRQLRSILEHIEHPDRDDQIRDERSQEARGDIDDRQQHRGVEREAAFAQIGQPTIDRLPECGWQLEAAIELGQLPQLLIQSGCQRRQVGDERRDLLDERAEGQAQALEDDDCHDRERDQDRHPARDPQPHQTLDERVQEVDQEQPDDEWRQRLAAHVQQDRDPDCGSDQEGDPRRGRRERPRRLRKRVPRPVGAAWRRTFRVAARRRRRAMGRAQSRVGHGLGTAAAGWILRRWDGVLHVPQTSRGG